MTLDLHYKKDAQEGVDWTYIVTAPSTYVFDLPHSSIPCDFRNKWLHVFKSVTEGKETVTMVVTETYAFDGCSVVPDVEGTVDAALIHDPIYQFVTSIAEAWGWGWWRVLKFADARFLDVMVYRKVNFVLRNTYYAGVLLFGPPYNRIAKLWRRWT